MATTSPIAGVTSTTTNVAGKQLLGQNFDTFLRLLTTQLQHQNPLDPLDTNQFTQQLVQFAQVEQQMNMNTSLNTLISLQQTAQVEQAVDLIGKTVVVGTDAAQLKDGQAKWSFTAPKAAIGTLTITDANGQTAYTRPYSLTAGAQSFTWDGKGNGGLRWAEGQYKISIAAKDSSGQAVVAATEVTGTVDRVDVTKKPPILMIGGQGFTLDAIKQVMNSGT